MQNSGKKGETNNKEKENQIKDFKYSISKDSSNENNENSYKITDSFPNRTIRTITDNNEIENFNFNETETTNKGGDSSSSNKIPNVIRNPKKKKTMKSNNPLDAKFTIDLLKEEEENKEEEIFKGLELRDILNNDYCGDSEDTSLKKENYTAKKTNDVIVRPDSPEEVDYSVDTEEFKFNLIKSNKTKVKSNTLLNNHTDATLEKNQLESRFLDFINNKNSLKEKTIEYNDNLKEFDSTYLHELKDSAPNQLEEQLSDISLNDLVMDGKLNDPFDKVDSMVLINKINKFHPNKNNISEINEFTKSIPASTEECLLIGRDSGEGIQTSKNNTTLHLAFLNKNASNVKEYYPKSKAKRSNLHIMTDNSNTPNKELWQSGYKNLSKVNPTKLHFTCPEESAKTFLTSNKTSRKSSTKNIMYDSQIVTPPKMNQFMTINTTSLNQNNLNVGLLGLYPNNVNNSNLTVSLNNVLVHPHTTTNSNNNHNMLFNTNFKSQNLTHKPNGINQQHLNYNLNNSNFQGTNTNVNNLNSLNNYNNQFFQKHVGVSNVNNPHHKSNHSNSTLQSSNQMFNPQYLNNTTLTYNTNNTNVNNQSSQKNSINQGSISYHNDSEHCPDNKFHLHPSKLPTEESIHSLNSCNINFNTQSPTNLNGNFPLNAYSREFNKNFSSSFTGNNMSNPYSQNFFGINPLMPQSTKINASNLGLGIQMYPGTNHIPGSNLQIKFPKAPVKSTLISSSSCFNHNILNNNNTIKEVFDFEVRLEDIAARIETRTTLMIKNVPNKYTLENVLNEIDEMGFKNKYVFFYLPPDLDVSTVIN